MNAVCVSSKHLRAICDEIGERLRQHIDRTQANPSQRILTLLRELEMAETETPSIVPSFDDITYPLFEMHSADD